MSAEHRSSSFPNLILSVQLRRQRSIICALESGHSARHGQIHVCAQPVCSRMDSWSTASTGFEALQDPSFKKRKVSPAVRSKHYLIEIERDQEIWPSWQLDRLYSFSALKRYRFHRRTVRTIEQSVMFARVVDTVNREDSPAVPIDWLFFNTNRWNRNSTIKSSLLTLAEEVPRVTFFSRFDAPFVHWTMPLMSPKKVLVLNVLVFPSADTAARNANADDGLLCQTSL